MQLCPICNRRTKNVWCKCTKNVRHDRIWCRLLASMLPFCGLCLCQVHALCSNGTRYQCAYDSPMSLPNHFKTWLTSVNHFPNFARKWPIVVDLSVGDIRWQFAAAQWSQWRAYRKPPSLFSMVLSMTLTTSHFTKMWSMFTPWPTSRCVLPPGEYDRRYLLYKISFAYDIMSRAMLPLAKCY